MIELSTMRSLAVDIFLKLVQISSPSYKEARVRNFIIAYLKKLGIRAKVDTTGNVYSLVPGHSQPLILSAHMDTVDPCTDVHPIIRKGVIYSDGTTVLGADDKAGIASILSLVTQLKKNKARHRALELIFTVEEEINCGGARELDFKKIKGKEAIVLDRSAPVFAITCSTPYALKVYVKCYGKSTHSRSPEDGVHAILMFAELVSKLRLGRKSKKVVTNIGTVTGGKAMNIIPDYTEAVGEIRSLDATSLQKERTLWDKISKKVAKKYKGKIVTTYESLLEGFYISKDNPFVKKVSAAITKAGFSPSYVEALGGSDANIFNLHGITAIPLGQGRKGAHSLNEAMPIKAFEDTEKILLNLVG